MRAGAWLLYASVLASAGCGRLEFTPLGNDPNDGAAVDGTPEPATWQVVARLPRKNWMSCSFAFEDRLYVIGGDDSGTLLAEVWMAPLDRAGVPGSWVPQAPLPSARRWHRCALDPGTRSIYVTGGDVRGSNALTVVNRATIMADGTITSWTAEPSLPEGRRGHGLVIAGGQLLVLGGEVMNGFVLRDTVLAASIAADGSLGAWSSTVTLPVPDYEFGGVTDGSHIYIAGGNKGGKKAYVAPVGGSFTATTTMTVRRERYSSILSNGYVYVVAGEETYPLPRLADTWRAPILANGDLGTWTQLASLSSVRAYTSIAATGTRIYVMGGDDDVAQLDEVFMLEAPP